MKNEHDKHPAAVALGKLNKGKPKRVTEEERVARRARMLHARKYRHKIKREVGSEYTKLDLEGKQ